jgi:acyl-CoA thioesterase YciA
VSDPLPAAAAVPLTRGTLILPLVRERAAIGGRGSLSETTMSERFPAIRVTMLPRDTNAYGTIFGGVILSYIDLAGGIECRRQSPKKFVTKAMHEVVFVAPVYLGDLVTFYTRTVRIGTTSITVDVEVEAERLGLAGTKEIVRVTEAEVIYVAVSNDGKPVPIKS